MALELDASTQHTTSFVHGPLPVFNVTRMQNNCGYEASILCSISFTLPLFLFRMILYHRLATYNWLKLLLSFRFQEVDCFWTFEKDLRLAKLDELVHVVGGDDLPCCLLCGQFMSRP